MVQLLPEKGCNSTAKSTNNTPTTRMGNVFGSEADSFPQSDTDTHLTSGASENCKLNCEVTKHLNGTPTKMKLQSPRLRNSPKSSPRNNKTPLKTPLKTPNKKVLRGGTPLSNGKTPTALINGNSSVGQKRRSDTESGFGTETCTEDENSGMVEYFIFYYVVFIISKTDYSIDVYTDSYLPPFFNDLSRLLQIVFCYLAVLISPTSLVDFQ